MNRILPIALASLLALAGTAAYAQDQQAITCQAHTIDLGDMPAGVDLTSISIDPVLLNVCTDPASEALTLISTTPDYPMTANHEVVLPVPNEGQTTTVTYTVSDASGHTGNGTLSIIRGKSPD